MKHKVKSLLFASLALLPNKVGDYLYHKIQFFFDKMTLESKLKSVEATYFRLNTVLEKISIPVKGKTILEIGSGWFPAMPYFFKYKLGAKQIITVDINKHFTGKKIAELNALFSKTHTCTIVPSLTSKLGLPEGVDYFSNYDILQHELPKADVVFSRYVLSHMKEKDVVAFHKKCSSKLAKGTIIVHFISPSDLRAHGDASLSLYDFLQYSKPEWEKIHTKFDYHNRLRLPQYLAIFEQCGLEVLHLEYQSIDQKSKQYELFKAIQVHKDYSLYSDEELTAGNILVVLKIS